MPTSADDRRDRANAESGLRSFGKFIEENEAEITRHWVAAVDRSPKVPGSEDLTFRQLLDHFPQLCRELAECLKTGGSFAPSGRTDAVSAAHGRKRWQQHFALDELIREISILRRDFTGRWFDLFAGGGVPLQEGEVRQARAIVHQFFDELIIGSVAQFVEEGEQRLGASARQLQLGNEKTATASSAQTDLVSLVGHELRTPLTPVLLAAAGLAAEKSLAPPVREFVELVQHQVQIEAGLIDDLLDASLVMMSQLQLSAMRKVDLHHCLTAARNACAPDFRSKLIAPVFHLKASRFHVLGDERRLCRALGALLRNAYEVSPCRAEVTVTTRDAGGDVEVAFVDQGPPLDEEALRKLFLPFEQGRRPSDFGMGGIGVSRFVARAVVEAHGGAIRAEPRGDRGAILTVRLKALPQ